MNEISVIIPTFQHGATLKACIESLLSQTVAPKEIIVVDDGSTDQTKEIVSAFSSVVSYQYQTNQGAPSARNFGAKLATGDFLIFCDADVIASPRMLERMFDALNQFPDASYAYSGFRWGTRVFSVQTFNPDLLRKRNFIHTTSLIRRQVFPGFDPGLKRFQDWDLWLTLLEQGCEGIGIDEELFQVIDVHGRKGISTWLPSVAYRFPWHLIHWKPAVLREYEMARDIIASKHQLV